MWPKLKSLFGRREPLKIEVTVRIEGWVELYDLHRNDSQGVGTVAVSQGVVAGTELSKGKSADAFAERKLADFKMRFEGQNPIPGLGQEADQKH